jgi:hypothetical protein
MIMVKTNYHCLRVGRHRWFQSITGAIHCVRTYFRKPTMRKRLDAHIRTIVVLTSGKLTRIYFLHLLSVIYYSITTHLRQGKKISILPLGNVNSGPVPLRRYLLEDSPYHAVGATCPSSDESQPHT